MKIDVSFLDWLDERIKRGEANAAGARLLEMRPADVPREYRAALAKTAVRIGETGFAFLLLRPLIHSETPLHPPVTPEETVQFGMVLKQLGASEHALRIFQSLPVGSKVPEAPLYEAITLFTQWRYREAIPKLEAYLLNEALTDYQRMVGSLNLASALIFEGEYDLAEKRLTEIVAPAAAEGLHLIHGNALELLSQVAIYRADYSLAEARLAEASLLIQQSAPVYKLFLAKWSAVLDLLKTNAAVESLRRLNDVRESAIQMAHWESVRDCDFFFATKKHDAHLFARLYFGTPFPAYRERLLKHVQPPMPIPETFDWRGNTAHYPAAPASIGLVDLGGDIRLPGAEPLKLGNQTHRLLTALSTDFYAPIKPFPLYLALFPDESLDPPEALPKVFTSVTRAKKWLTGASIPIDIANSNAGYKLDWHGPFILRVPQERSVGPKSMHAVQKLQMAYGNQSFTSTEAAEKLGLPQRSVVRLLQEAAANDLIASQGNGRGTRYRFKAA